jgi:hypothetical protein
LRWHTCSQAENFGITVVKAWVTNSGRKALEFAGAAASVPNNVTDELFDRMKLHWSEDQIVEITGVISVFGFLNRFNDSMATPLESQAIDDANRVLGKQRWSPGKHAG